MKSTPKPFTVPVLLLLISITAFAQQQTQDLEGYADLHVHQMANLGFGGSIVWGEAFGPKKIALRKIPANMRRGHDAAEIATHGNNFHRYVGTIVNAFIGDLVTHGEEGYPSFSSWPNTELWMHQQVYEKWLFRAYQGGLRLMVMLAVNSEDLFGRGENHIPLVGSHQFQKVRADGRTGNDMEALEWQIRAAYQFQSYIDQKCGGTGKGWYRIVRDPQEASEVIKSGKMAVILGTELQHLFNCDHDRPQCDRNTIVEGLNRLEGMGVNYVFPIHHKLNQFGGPAMFTPLNSGPMEKCEGYKHECSADGLTYTGGILVQELMARGMLIDTEHLSTRSFNDLMTIAEERNYPVLAGHIVPFELSEGNALTERAKKKEQIQRILNVGGIVAPILGVTTRDYPPVSHRPIPVSCRHPSDGGSADQWANAFLFMRDVAGGGVKGTEGRIAVGSDWNGFAGWPTASCDKNTVEYPITLPPRLVEDAITHTRKLPEFEFPKGKLWDFNKMGDAHIGMMPDFFQNLQNLGLTVDDLEPVYRSARGVVELWQRARDSKYSDDRHYLRWVPQSPFDVLHFSYREGSRDISARDGFPICRSRSGHLLGFEQDGKCALVETASAPKKPSPETISAYHDGRCLDIAETQVVQNRCDSPSPQQLWNVRELSGTYVQVVNNVSGKCLALKNNFAVQEPCDEKDDQVWDAKRTGNTFSLVAKQTNLCLEVRDQSRDDGAAIQQARCTDASNQKWTIESLRKDDFERLYQADKKQMPKEIAVFDWLETGSDDYPIAVTVDESKVICVSMDAEKWIGVVVGRECVGKTYAGAPATTSRFKQLFQGK